MGFDMQEGTLVRWLKQPGDQVAKGEPIAEIETDKAVIEIEAFESGTVKELLVEEGATVPVGAPIMIIDTGEGDGAADAAGGAPAPAPAAPAAPAADGTGRVKASPLARRLAAEHGVDLRSVVGTGPGGRIVKVDVLQAAETPAAQAAPAPGPAPAAPAPAPVPAAPAAPALEDKVVPLSRMRQTIARRMAESKQQAPHFYVTMAVHMDKAMELRANLNALGDGQLRVSVNDLVVKATAI